MKPTYEELKQNAKGCKGFRPFVFSEDELTALLEAYEADRLEKILLFADWISKGMWTRHEHTDKLEDVGKWYNTYRYSVMEEPLTTKELYELFESEVPKPFKPE
jgi:hypothetical protein